MCPRVVRKLRGLSPRVVRKLKGGGRGGCGREITIRDGVAVRSSQIEEGIRLRRQVAFSVGFIKFEGSATRRLEFGGITIRHNKRYFHFTTSLFPASHPSLCKNQARGS